MPELINFVSKRGGVRYKASFDDPFLWGMRLIDFPGQEIVGTVNRGKYAVELSYAFDHGIDWNVLDCFLAQAGGFVKIKSKRDRGYREPWARHLAGPVLGKGGVGPDIQAGK